MKKGFFDGLAGAGEPSGRVVAARPPMKAAKAAGVKDVASAGGGRPVSLAIKVLNHRMIVKIPKAEPRVLRRFPNCSATETIATEMRQQVPQYIYPQTTKNSPKNEL